MRLGLSKKTHIYLNPSQFGSSSVDLQPDEVHYLRRVLRKRDGDPFVALDSQGRSWLCQLGSGHQAVRVEDHPAAPPLSPHLTIGLSLCKGSRFESAIEKLSEIGCHRIIPMTTERTERKTPSASKLERWRDIARSASAVAGRTIPLQVSDPVALNEIISHEETVLGFCHPGGTAPMESLNIVRQRLTLLIGPEGGFSPSEVSSLENRAFSIDLGTLNLRVETAAVTCAVLAFHLFPKEIQACSATITQ